MKDSNVRRLSRLHRTIFRFTGGRIGDRLVDNDMLLLTTTGRLSGRPHTVPLLYLTHDTGFVVIASYGGRSVNPAWYLNLASGSEAKIQLAAETQSVRARTMEDAEREHWWPRIVEAYEGYAAYQQRTERQIPVVMLEPLTG